MSHKVKSNDFQGDKFLNKLIRLENTQASRKGLTPRQFTDKLSHVVKPPNVTQQQRFRAKVNTRQQSPVPKVLHSPHKEQELVPIKEPKSLKQRNRSVSEAGCEGKEREAWGEILKSNKSKEKVSNFSNFDPLRTLHFLSKELYTKLKKTEPDEEILQMVSDIQHALKRIPPEVSTFLHNPNETSLFIPKSLATKTCQTPPTLYQEDTETFQKLMEENTYRLEASCKQLEIVCTNLQNEKQMTEKDLDEARENIDLLCKRVKELEAEIEMLTTVEIKKLEEEKRHFKEELEKARLQMSDSSVGHYKKLAEDLKKEKTESDENCARLEYDMTLLKMEKEKFVTMLGIRDREIKEIQEEMSKIQDQVNQQLKKLNIEVMNRANSITSDPFMKDNFVDIGDTTISSISTNVSENGGLKESPCGDAEVTGMTKEQQHKLKADNVELDLLSREKESILEDLLAGLTPSLKTLLTSNNL